MYAIGDTLRAVAQGTDGPGAEELARRRAALEADLETMVRCVLRSGTGSPGLVRWVRGALPDGAGRGDAGAQRAAPVLARLLCRTLVNQFRQGRAAQCETIVGR